MLPCRAPAAAGLGRTLSFSAMSSSSQADQGAGARDRGAQRLDDASPDQRGADAQKHAIAYLLYWFQQQVVLLNIMELDGVGGRGPSVKVMYDVLRSMNADDYHFPASAFAKGAGGSRGSLKKGLKAEELWSAWLSFSSVSDFPDCLRRSRLSIMTNCKNPFPTTPPRADVASGKRSRSTSHAPYTSVAKRWEVRKRVNRGVDEFSARGWRATEVGVALESREFEHVRAHVPTGLLMWKGLLDRVLGFVSPHQLPHVVSSINSCSIFIFYSRSILTGSRFLFARLSLSQAISIRAPFSLCAAFSMRDPF